jgi:multiple sugar transport system permease protein
MNRKITPGKIVLEIVSVCIAVLFLTPVIWSLAVSLKTEGVPIHNAFNWFTPPFTLENYPKILLETKVPFWLFNSFFVAILSTVLVLFISSMAAYPLAKLNFPGKNILYLFFLIGMIVPGEATIVPLFITANGLNMIDSYAGLIMPTIAGSMNLIIMVAFFKSIPNEMIEAAQIDGANNFSIYFRIILPLSKTVLVTVGIFAFIGSWNNYLWPLLCTTSDTMFTLPVGIPTFAGTYTVDYVKPMTANMVASIPAIIIYLIFEKRIVKGVALSGIKG